MLQISLLSYDLVLLELAVQNPAALKQRLGPCIRSIFSEIDERRITNPVPSPPL
jgi:hypothetical protein